MWETWSGDSSRNHHMFSDISAWFYKGLAGINPDPDAPGFKNIIFKPNPVGDLKWVNAWHECMYGKIVCNWAVEGDNFILDIVVPTNSTGTVYIPTSAPDSIMEGDKPVYEHQDIQVEEYQRGYVKLLVQSGKYRFISKL